MADRTKNPDENPFKEARNDTLVGGGTFAASTLVNETSRTAIGMWSGPFWLAISSAIAAVAAIIGASKAADKLEEKLDDVDGLKEEAKGALKGAGSSLPEAGISGIVAAKGLGGAAFLNAALSNFFNPLFLFGRHLTHCAATGKWDVIRATNQQMVVETGFAAAATFNTLAFGFTVGLGVPYLIASGALLAGYLGYVALIKPHLDKGKKDPLAAFNTEAQDAGDDAENDIQPKKKKSKAAQWAAVTGALVAVVGLASLGGALLMYGASVAAVMAPKIALGGLLLPAVAAFLSSLPEFIMANQSYNSAGKAVKDAKKLRETFKDAGYKPENYGQRMMAYEQRALDKKADAMQNIMVSAFVNMTLVAGVGAAAYMGFGHGVLNLGAVLGGFGLTGLAGFGAVAAVLAPSLLLMGMVLMTAKGIKDQPREQMRQAETRRLAMA